MRSCPTLATPTPASSRTAAWLFPYTINSALTPLSGTAQTTSAVNTMVYGDPMNYELGLFGDYTVEVSKDYKFGEAC